MESQRTTPWLIGGAVFLLFSVWAWSFIAIESLVVSDADAPRFDWLSLTVARFGAVAILCGGYLAFFRRREALEVVSLHWRRLMLCGLLCVPGYNFAMAGGQGQRVPAPVASLLTTLAPLFIMLLSAAFLKERITKRRAGGFALAVTGLVLVSASREDPGGVAYPLSIALTAMGPLCWSIHSVLTKPVMTRVSPLVWTYLVVTIGGAPLLLLSPFTGTPEALALDAPGWTALGFLILPCTVLGFALWSWLLRQLPATSVGFTIFLNPPLTTIYKLLQAFLFPTAIAYTLLAGEAAGGVLILAGVALALCGSGSMTGPEGGQNR